ncbi:unnamed protein product [Orchesella dallaii]|uniref:Uncharacterized protein n=1 Tax=Orchesella dallaii TaxID=48710 RepID=A0ABP1RH06_9HEXA
MAGGNVIFYAQVPTSPTAVTEITQAISNRSLTNSTLSSGTTYMTNTTLHNETDLLSDYAEESTVKGQHDKRDISDVWNKVKTSATAVTKFAMDASEHVMNPVVALVNPLPTRKSNKSKPPMPAYLTNSSHLDKATTTTKPHHVEINSANRNVTVTTLSQVSSLPTAAAEGTAQLENTTSNLSITSGKSYVAETTSGTEADQLSDYMDESKVTDKRSLHTGKPFYLIRDGVNGVVSFVSDVGSKVIEAVEPYVNPPRVGDEARLNNYKPKPPKPVNPPKPPQTKVGTATPKPPQRKQPTHLQKSSKANNGTVTSKTPQAKVLPAHPTNAPNYKGTTTTKPSQGKEPTHRPNSPNPNPQFTTIKPHQVKEHTPLQHPSKGGTTPKPPQGNAKSVKVTNQTMTVTKP